MKGVAKVQIQQVLNSQAEINKQLNEDIKRVIQNLPINDKKYILMKVKIENMKKIIEQMKKSCQDIDKETFNINYLFPFNSIQSIFEEPQKYRNPRNMNRMNSQSEFKQLKLAKDPSYKKLQNLVIGIDTNNTITNEYKFIHPDMNNLATLFKTEFYQFMTKFQDIRFDSIQKLIDQKVKQYVQLYQSQSHAITQEMVLAQSLAFKKIFEYKFQYCIVNGILPDLTKALSNTEEFDDLCQQFEKQKQEINSKADLHVVGLQSLGIMVSDDFNALEDNVILECLQKNQIDEKI